MGVTASKGSGKIVQSPKQLNLGIQTPPLTSLEHLAADYAHYLTPSLTTLNVSNNELTSLPANLFGLIPNLEILDVSGNMLKESLPNTLPILKHLREVYLGMNRFPQIPEPVFYLASSLCALEIGSNGLVEIPEKISTLVNLTRLDVTSNSLTALPAELGALSNLMYLRARANKIESVPAEIGSLMNLVQIDLRQNELQELPDNFFPPSLQLERVLLADNQLRELPRSITECSSVTELDLSGNKLTSLPPLNNLSQLKRLILHDNRLSEIPVLDNMEMLRELDLRSNELTSLDNLKYCPSLQILALHDNFLPHLPASLAFCKNLEELDAGVNDLDCIDESVFDSTGLVRLYLSDNHITKVSANLTKLTRLKVLGLSFNQLGDKSFEEDMWANLTSLVELRLLGNNFTALPPSFHKLPRLDRLFFGYNKVKPYEPPSAGEPDMLSFSHLTSTQLSLSGNELVKFPSTIIETTSLRKLWLGDCGLKSIPSDIGKLVALDVLDLSNNKLTKLPKSIGKLSLLVELLVPCNDLSRLPNEIENLTSLQLLDFSHNPKLNKLPDGIARINSLLQVKAIHCSLEELPAPWMSFTSHAPAPPPILGLMTPAERPPPPTGLQLKWLALEGNPMDCYSLPIFVKGRVDQELRAVMPKSRPRLHDVHAKKAPAAMDEPTNPSYIPVDLTSVRLEPIPAENKCMYDIGVSEMQGIRPTMEDSFLIQETRGVVVGPYTFEVLAVFDGHADAACAEFCATHFHDIMQSELSYALQPKESSTSKVALMYKDPTKESAASPGPTSPVSPVSPGPGTPRKRESGRLKSSKKSTGDPEHDYFVSCVKHGLRNTFKRMNDCIDEYDIQSGCTVALALFCGNDAWLISCGDARITLSVGGRALRATIDHKATDKEERHRVQSLGGYITENGRIMGMIAVARSLGDRAFRPYVAYTPCIKYMRVTEEYKFAIIACDGLWDVCSDEFAVNLVKEYHKRTGSYAGAALYLREAAYALGSGDNISTMVFGLRPCVEKGSTSHHGSLVASAPVTIPSHHHGHSHTKASTAPIDIPEPEVKERASTDREDSQAVSCDSVGSKSPLSDPILANSAPASTDADESAPPRSAKKKKKSSKRVAAADS